MPLCLAELLWYSPRLWPLAMALAIVVGWLILWLYRPQVKMLGQPWRALLPGLRLAAMAALVLSILKPVSVRNATPEESGAILVIVDRSRSMSVHDLAFLPGEIQKGHGASAAGYLVGMADGLGMLRQGTGDPLLGTLQTNLRKLRGLYDELVRARSELDFARVSGQGADVARSRVAQAQDQFRTAALQVLPAGASIPHGGNLRHVLGDIADLGKGNIDPTSSRAPEILASAERSVENAQAEADLTLYQSNPDVRAMCDQIANLSRFGRTELALTNSGGGLLNQIPADVPLFGFSIAENAIPLPLRGGGQPVRRLLIEPNGLRSDITGGLRTAMDRVQGQALQAVVLFSDGQQVGGDSTVPSALTASGVPVFPVYTASMPRDLPLKDIAVNRLSVPQSCFVGESLNARVELRTSGYKNDAGVVAVSLSIDGASPTTKPTALADGPVTQEFPLKFDKPGIHRITASIPTPADAPTGENKSIERWIKVLSDKVKLGMYAGTASWDFQYVRDALGRTPWVDLKDGILADESAKFPLTPEQILSLDLLVLFDVSPTTLSDAQWDAVYKLVSERGGSVILVAGDEHLPGEYASQKLAASFLPFLPGQKPVWRTWPGKDPGFHLVPAAGTGTLDGLKLDDNPSGDTWGQLPAFFRYLSLPDLKPNARALLIDRDSSSPVLLESRLGLGKVLFFGATETWRWRYKKGEKIQDRFWMQLVRYAADEPYAAESGNLALDANMVNATPGEPIKIRARVAQADGSPSTAETQTAEILKDDAVLKTVMLTAAGSAGSGRYRGTLTDLTAGDYQFRLQSTPPGQSVMLPLHIAPSTEAEMANLAGDDHLLRRLADASGGTFLTLDQVGTLPDLIAKTRVASSRISERPLWDSYYLFLFVLACLGAEWAIRKHVGLS